MAGGRWAIEECFQAAYSRWLRPRNAVAAGDVFRTWPNPARRRGGRLASPFDVDGPVEPIWGTISAKVGDDAPGEGKAGGSLGEGT